MPFGFRRKGPLSPPTSPPGPSGDAPRAAEARRSVHFDALTEDWRIVGRMEIVGRMSDTLNRRATLAISDVSWAPIERAGDLEPAPGLSQIDPYDLLVVVAGEGSLLPLSEDQRVASRVHKVPYDVALEVPPFRLTGTVLLYPGSEPERLLDRTTELFFPVTQALVYNGATRLGSLDLDVVLVNRASLRGVEQLDHDAITAMRERVRAG